VFSLFGKNGSGHFLFLNILVSKPYALTLVTLIVSVILLYFASIHYIFACIQSTPVLKDAKLKPELVYKGLHFPTSFAFLGHDDILVLEKETGTVRRIIEGKMQNEPLLDVNVATRGERGLLGVATNVSDDHTYVFLYYTETPSEDGEDIVGQIDPLGNRLYRYELVGDKLINPILYLDLAATPGFYHVGGALTIGPDGNPYLAVGDVDHRTAAENYEEGGPANGTGGILRVTQDGKAILPSILGDNYPLNLYYAYGIRNSFGIDFDPLSGILWDTENGPNFGDEINLVQPGFNSGFARIQGIWEPVGEDKGKPIVKHENLSLFGGRGTYRHPELIWDYTVGASAIKFFNSSNYGEMYKNDLFVGNANGQPLYHFDLNENRTGLNLSNGPLDRIVKDPVDLQHYIFAEGTERVTDMEVGLDGNLYILCHNWNEDSKQRLGSLFRIVSVNETISPGLDWINEDPSVISTDIRTTINQGNDSKWSILSSDYLPINGETYYTHTVNISAIHVNQLHAKIYYFDANKKELNWSLVFGGLDGSFDTVTEKVLKAPPDAIYMKLQFWVRPNSESNSYFIVHNVAMEQEWERYRVEPGLNVRS
jgi:aldose sugar dehydrogenase